MPQSGCNYSKDGYIFGQHAHSSAKITISDRNKSVRKGVAVLVRCLEEHSTG